MRSTWLPFGIALVFPAMGLLGACGPGTESTTTEGGSTTTSTTEGGGGSTGTTTAVGGGGTGGTGGTGGFEPPANDACPGEKVSLAIGASKTIAGTLKGAIDDYVTFCADTNPDPGNPDVVYQLDVPASATVTMKVTGSGFVPALSLRKQTCGERIGGDTCLNLGAGGGTVKVALEAGSYWVVIDSADGKTGDFSFDVSFAAPACGDGAVNPGETCDPVLIAGDDGCINPGMDNACHFGEAPPDPAIVSCPGGLVTIGKNDPIQLGPYNNGAGQSSYHGTCAPDPSAMGVPPSGPENVFHLVPKDDGTLTVQIGHAEDGTSLYCDDPDPNDMIPPPECADFVMYLRKGACNSVVPANELACSDNTPNPASPFGFDELLTITTPVTKDTDYWLFVDGLDNDYGIGGYYLQLSLQ